VPVMRRWIGAVAVFVLPLHVDAADAQCTHPYDDCYESTCCTNGYGCYKKMHRKYAQCRPLPPQGCADVPGWECPGWELCSDNHQPCIDSKCCKDPSYGCFRRPNNHYAQCRPLLDGVCTDTEEWKCPGWELCSDILQGCTSTHCCADSRYSCYAKTPHYAQCMARGTCRPGVDGTCEELVSQLGQCSAQYQDCHLTACCQRGEDHCYLKNDNYGKCMPRCDAVTNRDWHCKKRELPSERAKLTCEDLRDRNNLHHQACATQYQDEASCNMAYFSHNNVYRPCNYRRDTQTCEENGQKLACDCFLFHKGCPVTANSQADAANAAGDSADDGLTTGEAVIVTLAVIIIIGGCSGIAWYFMRGPSTVNRMVDEPTMDAEDDPPSVTTKTRRTKKNYNVTEIDAMEL